MLVYSSNQTKNIMDYRWFFTNKVSSYSQLSSLYNQSIIDYILDLEFNF